MRSMFPESDLFEVGEASGEMQEREPGKAGGSTPTPAKHGRPFGSTSTGGAASSASAGSDSAAWASLLGPSFQVPASFTDQNHRRIALALQSGLKNELTWDLNMLMFLSFKEKDDHCRDATLLDSNQRPTDIDGCDPITVLRSRN